MDFHQAFFEIDTDHSGEITKEELESYMKKMNYKETFVQRWLSIFDIDNSGTITYEEYCETLGLIPKEEDIENIEQATAIREESGAPISRGAAARRASRVKKDQPDSEASTKGAEGKHSKEVDEEMIGATKASQDKAEVKGAEDAAAKKAAEDAAAKKVVEDATAKKAAEDAAAKKAAEDAAAKKAAEDAAAKKAAEDAAAKKAAEDAAAKKAAEDAAAKKAAEDAAAKKAAEDAAAKKAAQDAAAKKAADEAAAKKAAKKAAEEAAEQKAAQDAAAKKAADEAAAKKAAKIAADEAAAKKAAEEAAAKKAAQDAAAKKAAEEAAAKKAAKIAAQEAAAKKAAEEAAAKKAAQKEEAAKRAKAAAAQKTSSTKKRAHDEGMDVDEGGISGRQVSKTRAASKKKKAGAGPSNDSGKGALRAGESRNDVISKKHGLMRFSRARVIEKKALYRCQGSNTTVRAGKKAKESSSAPPPVEKEVGGERNGGKRMVPQERSPRYVEPQKGRRRRKHGKTFSEQKHRLRSSIQPGSILILLAGAHRGKRVVFLKQMPSTGLLLVTGPYKINGCPLRRVNQRIVIATKTRVPLDDIDLPERLTDEYFRRIKKNRRNKEDSDIFQKTESRYQLTEERKEDQKTVDSAVMAAIARHKETKALKGYLRSSFSLKTGDRPHAMEF